MISLAVWVIVPFALGFILAVLCEGVMYWILRNWDSQDAKKRRTREYFWKWFIVHLLLLGPLLILAFALLQMAPFFFSGIIGGEIYFYLRKNPHRLRVDDGPQGEVEPFNPFDDDCNERGFEGDYDSRQTRERAKSSEVFPNDGFEPPKKEEISLRKVLLVVFAILATAVIAPTIWAMVSIPSARQQGVIVLNPGQTIDAGDMTVLSHIIGAYEVREVFHVLEDSLTPTSLGGGIRYTFEFDSTLRIEHEPGEHHPPTAWGAIRIRERKADATKEMPIPNAENLLGAAVYQISVFEIDDPALLLSGVTEFDMYLIFADDGDVIIYIPALSEVSLAREV